jgi:hypothetical protein
MVLKMYEGGFALSRLSATSPRSLSVLSHFIDDSAAHIREGTVAEEGIRAHNAAVTAAFVA